LIKVRLLARPWSTSYEEGTRQSPASARLFMSVERA